MNKPKDTNTIGNLYLNNEEKEEIRQLMIKSRVALMSGDLVGAHRAIGYICEAILRLL